MANPPAELLDANVVNRLARASAAGGVESLRKRIVANEGWLVRPQSQRKVVEYKDVEFRFRKATRQVPNWKIEYETYEVPVVVQDGSTTRIDRVKRQREVRRVQAGTREDEYLVADPNGPIVQLRKQPVFGPGGPDVLRVDLLAHNAMGLYAMLRAGVPAEDEAVSLLLANLDKHLDAWSLPDTTVDLAWLGAAYAVLPGKGYDERRRSLALKLLTGQIAAPPGKGMWGPVCIDLAALARLLEYDRQLSVEYDKAKPLAEKTRNAALTNRVQAIENYRRQVAETYAQIARDGLLFEAIRRPILHKGPGEESIMYAGLPLYIYNQQVADIEHTALVLWSLRLLKDAGSLPAATAEHKGMGSTIVVRAMPVAPILSAAAQAVTSRQRDSDGWDECNLLQPAREFDRSGLPNTPAPKLPDLASLQTLAAVGQGRQAMFAAMDLARVDHALPRNALNAQRATRAAARAADAWLACDPAGPIAPPVGRRPGPYDLLLALTGIQRPVGGQDANGLGLWRRLAYRTALLQNEDGSWGPRGIAFTAAPSCLAARIEAMGPREHEGRMARLPADKRQPYDQVYALRAEFDNRFWQAEPAVVATASAVIFLCDALRPSTQTQPAGMGPPAAVPGQANSSTERKEALAEIGASTLQAGKDVTVP